MFSSRPVKLLLTVLVGLFTLVVLAVAVWFTLRSDSPALRAFPEAQLVDQSVIRRGTYWRSQARLETLVGRDEISNWYRGNGWLLETHVDGCFSCPVEIGEDDATYFFGLIDVERSVVIQPSDGVQTYIFLVTTVDVQTGPLVAMLQR